MITKKEIYLLIVAIFCIILSYLIIPYGKQYEGASGYIYEYGWLFALGNVVLLIIGLLIITYVIIDNYKIEERRKEK